MDEDEFPFQAGFEERMRLAKADLQLAVGDIYEDCAFHPVICMGVSYEEDELWGVSLVDGSYPRSCSLVHCGVRKLTPAEAWDIRMHGPVSAEDRDRIPIDKRWWFHARATG
jgi:hypothetical protein